MESTDFRHDGSDHVGLPDGVPTVPDLISEKSYDDFSLDIRDFNVPEIKTNLDASIGEHAPIVGAYDRRLTRNADTSQRAVGVNLGLNEMHQVTDQLEARVADIFPIRSSEDLFVGSEVFDAAKRGSRRYFVSAALSRQNGSPGDGGSSNGYSRHRANFGKLRTGLHLMREFSLRFSQVLPQGMEAVWSELSPMHARNIEQVQYRYINSVQGDDDIANLMRRIFRRYRTLQLSALRKANEAADGLSLPEPAHIDREKLKEFIGKREYQIRMQYYHDIVLEFLGKNRRIPGSSRAIMRVLDNLFGRLGRKGLIDF